MIESRHEEHAQHIEPNRQDNRGHAGTHLQRKQASEVQSDEGHDAQPIELPHLGWRQVLLVAGVVDQPPPESSQDERPRSRAEVGGGIDQQRFLHVVPL
jgi:hypothetical protein